ncbi:tetratricopeptide repeat protein [Thalassotalea atypica]|uniref:tetratricopeptide repeat protein n=1 Tax=Thalassotalea atypica TaxID=2054316 RepID=UPI0025738F8C|nr:tetratricopeptide repeat protein [Thalassotalea atypica]
MKTTYYALLAISIFTVLFSPNATAFRDNETCGIISGAPLTNSYGPFDFRNPNNKDNVHLVLGAHFKKNIERLESSKSGKGTAHGDLDYTLRALPNHHRALYAVSTLERRDLKQLQPGETLRRTNMYTAACYFKRAIYFRPKDPIPYMLYGIHLKYLNNLSLAENYYLQAYELDPKNPEIQYNLGLLYVEIGDLKQAKHFAKLAYDNGYPLLGLKHKIEKKETEQSK